MWTTHGTRRAHFDFKRIFYKELRIFRPWGSLRRRCVGVLIFGRFEDQEVLRRVCPGTPERHWHAVCFFN